MCWVGGLVVSWRSKEELILIQSIPPEVEYVALSASARDVTWLNAFNGFIQFEGE